MINSQTKKRNFLKSLTLFFVGLAVFFGSLFSAPAKVNADSLPVLTFGTIYFELPDKSDKTDWAAETVKVGDKFGGNYYRIKKPVQELEHETAKIIANTDAIQDPGIQAVTCIYYNFAEEKLLIGQLAVEYVNTTINDVAYLEFYIPESCDITYIYDETKGATSRAYWTAETVLQAMYDNTGEVDYTLQSITPQKEQVEPEEPNNLIIDFGEIVITMPDKSDKLEWNTYPADKDSDLGGHYYRAKMPDVPDAIGGKVYSICNVSLNGKTSTLAYRADQDSLVVSNLGVESQKVTINNETYFEFYIPETLEVNYAFTWKPEVIYNFKLTSSDVITGVQTTSLKRLVPADITVINDSNVITMPDASDKTDWIAKDIENGSVYGGRYYRASFTADENEQKKTLFNVYVNNGISEKISSVIFDVASGTVKFGSLPIETTVKITEPNSYVVEFYLPEEFELQYVYDWNTAETNYIAYDTTHVIRSIVTTANLKGIEKPSDAAPEINENEQELNFVQSTGKWFVELFGAQTENMKANDFNVAGVLSLGVIGIILFAFLYIIFKR